MSKPRTTEPGRCQGVICFELPDDALEAEHPARVLWQVLGTLDLGKFLSLARAVEGHAGRPTPCARMLLTLWMYAISQGVGSAREIERLVSTDRAFGWIVGDVAVSHHALSRFRIGHRAALDPLMTDILAALVHKGVLSLQLVALDGMRVRAAAAAPSFRREASLLECREQAALHLKAVLSQADDPELSLAQRAARERGAREFQARVEAAISTVHDLLEDRKPSAPPARASTTDAEARVMKMGDGGFRPAMNVRCATAGSELGGPRTVVAVEVTNVGSDMGALTPMLAQIEARTGELPTTVLADAFSREPRSDHGGDRTWRRDAGPRSESDASQRTQRQPRASDRRVQGAHGDRRGQAALPRASRALRVDQRERSQAASTCVGFS